ncbi:MAG: glycosyltransferase [Planctomycetes bacterium]|nr:glycosyltransferase [Planctomycetota bacterium]
MGVSEVVILIPAFKPGPRLVDFVQELAVAGARIVVVDDGSGPEFGELFAALQRVGETVILRHAINLGKGAALKTGLNYIACEAGGCVGVVTADADGQHILEDVLAVADSLTADPQSLILGVRGFEGELPLRSRLGNALTRHVMRWIMGQNVSDTQTGLRGIPMAMIPRLLVIPHQGYEFELEMLLICKYEGVRIRETGIQTIYLDGNRSSHFNPLLDSFRIYFVLLRFTFVSLISAVLDNLVFAAVFACWPNLGAAQITGRVLATLFNFWGNRNTVFRSKEQVTRTLPKYLLLVAVSGAMSYGLIRLFSLSGVMDVYVAKILAETILFFANFVVQRDFVFPRPQPWLPETGTGAATTTPVDQHSAGP